MKKLIKLVIIGNLICLLLVSVLIKSIKISSYQIEKTKVKLEVNDNLEHKRLIYEIIESVSYPVAAKHEYKIHKFDCTDFSKELKERLIEKGLNAYCVFGIMKGANYPLHSWVEIRINEANYIWVESTTGDIIELENKDNYKLLSKTKVCI